MDGNSHVPFAWALVLVGAVLILFACMVNRFMTGDIMKTKYPHMFSPITIEGCDHLKNRIWSAPAGAHLLYGKKGYPNDHVVAYYANKAEAAA